MFKHLPTQLVALVKKVARVGLHKYSLARHQLTNRHYARRLGLQTASLAGRTVVGVRPQLPFNGHQETADLVDAITSALKANDIDYFAIPNLGDSVTIAVMQSHRHQVLELIESQPSFSGHYYEIFRDRYNSGLTELVDRGLPRLRNNIVSVLLYRHLWASPTRIIDGRRFGVRIEFWFKPDQLSPRALDQAMAESGVLDPEALADSLVAPRYNRVAKVYSGREREPSTRCLFGQNHPTLGVFNENLINQVNFPVDVVYTWVDGNDPQWRQKYLRELDESGASVVHNSSSRYTSREELRYSIRSIETFAPWVRKIFVVTDGQIPPFLTPDDPDDPNARLIMVDHRDIFEDPDALPVFNSHAIESQLHHIEGLSEHFLYVNDDVFFAMPTEPDTFFYPNGIAKLSMGRAMIGTGEPTEMESAPSSAGKNARQIIASEFGVYATNKPRHSVHPQIRSQSYAVYRNNADQLGRTMRSKFRSPSDIPFTSVLMQNYLLAAGQGVPSPLHTLTINISRRDSRGEMWKLLDDHRVSVVCLNESDTAEADSSEVDRDVAAFLDSYYPFPSRWEL